MRKVSELKENPLSTSIYGLEEDISDLLESIPRCGGIISPLLVKPDGTIISGHRRFRAAKQLGMEAVPCEGCDPVSVEDETILVVEANKNRVKTAQQIFDEGQKLTAALEEIARRRKYQNLKQYNGMNHSDVAQWATSENGEKEPPKTGRTVTVVADSLGLSAKSWQRIQYVGRYAQMRNSTAMDAMSKLNAGKITVRKAYDLVRASLKLSEDAKPEEPQDPYIRFSDELTQADEHLSGLYKIFNGFLAVDTPEHPTDIQHWEDFCLDMQEFIFLLKKLENIRLERRKNGSVPPDKNTDYSSLVGIEEDATGNVQAEVQQLC